MMRRSRWVLLALALLLPAGTVVLLAREVPAQNRATEGRLRPVAGKGVGTLKGRVSLRGPRPDLGKRVGQVRASLRRFRGGEEGCVLASPREIARQTWDIDDRGGVGNVIVWLRPPEGYYFPVDPARKTWPDEVVLEAPHGVFVPHAFVLFPAYRDPRDPRRLVPTGQKLRVDGRAKKGFRHAIRWDGRDAGNSGSLGLVDSGVVKLYPSESPVGLRCSIHPWMTAWARVLDHPYAAVTGLDGRYEIKNVPTGVTVRLVAWHEEVGWVFRRRGAGAVLELKERTTTRDFRICAAD